MTTVAAPLLAIDHLDVTVDGHALLRDVSLRLERGRVTGVIGPNGAGKTTLVRAVTGALPRLRGTVTVDGRPIEQRSGRDRAREIAVVEQLPEAPATMRVGELVLLGRYPHLGLLGRESAHDRAVARAAMEQVGCDALAGRELSTLSGGERRRVFIARALAQEPQLLLLDEPTSGLDASAQAEIFALLRRLAGGGMGVLVVVHDLTLAAAACDRLLLLHHGEVVAAGEPHAVVTAEHIARVYGRYVTVLAHPVSGAPLVVPTAIG